MYEITERRGGGFPQDVEALSLCLGKRKTKNIPNKKITVMQGEQQINNAVERIGVKMIAGHVNKTARLSRCSLEKERSEERAHDKPHGGRFASRRKLL